jgi:hypothetical protein
MGRLVVSGLGLVLLFLVGCNKQEPPISKRPAAAGEAARPFRPGDSKGEWEDPRLRELRGAGPSPRR